MNVLDTIFVVYTTANGGIMKVIWATPEMYEEMKSTRLYQERNDMDNPPSPVRLYMVAKAKPEEIWDFSLDRDRLCAS